MKKFSKGFILAIVVSFILSVIGPLAVSAATMPPLGTTDTFGVLSNLFQHNTATTTIVGDLGYSSTAGTGPVVVTGTTYPNNAVYNQAGTDQGVALANLNGQACTLLGAGALNAINIGGGPGHFTPGCYYRAGAIDITANTTVYLDGNGIYIFKSTGGAITTGASSTVTLTGGASDCDVFWIASGATTLGATSNFVGTVIDAAGITIGDVVTWAGRALAYGGTVTANGLHTITAPTGCSAYVAPTSSSRRVPIVPLIDIIKVPTPLALPGGPGQVTYNYTVTNVGGQQPLIDVTVVDDKCSPGVPLTLSSGDLNNDGKLDANENWKYSCTSILTSTTTNTAIATGHSSDGYYNTAIATVAVGTQIQPPLINVVKVPNQLTPFPFGGGDVTYTYTVTNPGVVPMNNIVVTDDKCPSVSFISGDTNGNNLLDLGETWIYTCKTNIKVSTGNVATAKGNANGFTAIAYAFSNVLVSSPELPNTGFGPEGITISWVTIILAIAVVILSIWLGIVLKKQNNKIKI
jgi:uncharacterized repeat protein (TIGR01451 family)